MYIKEIDQDYLLLFMCIINAILIVICVTLNKSYNFWRNNSNYYQELYKQGVDNSKELVKYTRKLIQINNGLIELNNKLLERKEG